MRAAELYTSIQFFIYQFSPQIKKHSRCDVIYKSTEKYYFNLISRVPVTLVNLEKAVGNRAVGCIALTRAPIAFRHVNKAWLCRGVKSG